MSTAAGLGGPTTTVDSIRGIICKAYGKNKFDCSVRPIEAFGHLGRRVMRSVANRPPAGPWVDRATRSLVLPVAYGSAGLARDGGYAAG